MQYAIDVRPLSELTFITDFTSDFTSVCPSHIIKYPVYPCAFKSLSVATFRTFSCYLQQAQGETKLLSCARRLDCSPFGP